MTVNEISKHMLTNMTKLSIHLLLWWKGIHGDREWDLETLKFSIRICLQNKPRKSFKNQTPWLHRFLKRNTFTEQSFYPSYEWISIIWGKKLLAKGLVWRIGNGTTVNIYTDNRLPRPTLIKPIAPPTFPIQIKVNTLISTHGSWCESLINSHFLPIDAHFIKSIPLPNTHVTKRVFHYKECICTRNRT